MRIWLAVRRDPLALCCLALLALVALGAVAAPWLAPYDPTAMHVRDKFAACSWAHPLGTDQLGRDVLSRLLWGGRATLGFSLLTMAFTLLVGAALGLVAAFCKGKVDACIMRVCDVVMSFPSEVMILAIVGMLGPGLGHIVLASVMAKWPWYTRMIRSTALRLVDMNHVRFARTAGCGMGHILRRHLLPGAAGEIIVLATLDTGAVILAVSALSFLGLGVQPPHAEWGAMLSEAKNALIQYPQQMLPPGLCILLVVAAFNFLGDSLRDALDPAHTTPGGVRP